MRGSFRSSEMKDSRSRNESRFAEVGKAAAGMIASEENYFAELEE